MAGIARATVDHAKQRPHSIERNFKVKGSIGHGLERSASRTGEGEGVARIEFRGLLAGPDRSTYGKSRSSADDDTPAYGSGASDKLSNRVC